MCVSQHILLAKKSRVIYYSVNGFVHMVSEYSLWLAIGILGWNGNFALNGLLSVDHGCNNIKTKGSSCLGEIPSIHLVLGYKQHWVYCWYFEVPGSSSKVNLPAVV